MLFAFDRHSDDIIIIDGSLLFIYSRSSNCLISRTDLPHTITALLQHNGQLILATESGYIGDYMGQPLKFIKISEFPILSLHTDSGRLFAATAINLIYFDADKFTFASVLEFPTDRAMQVFFRNQRLLVAEKQIIYCYMHKHGQFSSTGNIYLTSPLLGFAHGRRWLAIATEGALQLFDFISYQFEKALKKSQNLTLLAVNQIQDYTILSGYNAQEKTILFYDLNLVDSIFKIRCSQQINYYKYSGSQMDDCKLTVIFGDYIPQVKNVDLQINKNKIFNLSLTQQVLGLAQPVKLRQQLAAEEINTETAILQTELSELEYALLYRDYELTDTLLEKQNYEVLKNFRPEHLKLLADFLCRGVYYWRIRWLREIVYQGYELTVEQKNYLQYGRMCYYYMKVFLDRFYALNTYNFVVGELEPLEELEAW